MIFSSLPFLYYFLPVTLLCYLAVPKKLKNVVLLASSLLFYAWGERLLVLLFLLSILVNFYLALFLDRIHSSGSRRLLLLVAVVWNLGLLGYFKYADFFIENLNRLMGGSIPLLGVVLPIGISFYTFQLLGYIFDVYRNAVPAQRNPLDFAAYVSMFPQLIAGPIVRYADVSDRLKNRSHSLPMIAEGTRRFMVGLGKKVLIANVLGELVQHAQHTTEKSILYFWLYAFAYTLQIYYDFSGYSDMAIGLGKILGFDFMENFNYPYISKSITEFWRRWHISLGSWFRDYVYIPLGGNRKGLPRQLVNILIVWLLTGFWHGASWNFLFWGLFYAILLTIEKLGFKKWLDRHPIAGHVYTLFFVVTGFVIFNAEGMGPALRDLSGLISFRTYPVFSTAALYDLRSYMGVLLMAVFGATPLPKKGCQKLAAMCRGNGVPEGILSVVEAAFPAVVLLMVTAYLVDGSFNPFLYFRF